MILLLTGGTGFFGKSVLRYLISRAQCKWKIVVLSRDPHKFLTSYPEFSCLKNLSFLKGDIEVRESLPWFHKFSHVLHAATDSTIGSSITPLKRYCQIVDGTRNVLDLAVATGATRFLFTSSGAIYGPQVSDLMSIPEDWSGSPPLADTGTAYGQAKRAAEYLCSLYREVHGLEIVVARCFAFIGPDLPLNVHFAIGNFIRDALSRAAITVSGDGTPLRTYLDQHDLAYWLITLLEQGRPGEAYNVGSGDVISIAELAYLVRDILSPSKSVHILGNPSFGSLRNNYVPDIRKAFQHLCLTSTIPLSDSIRRTGASYL